MSPQVTGLKAVTLPKISCWNVIQHKICWWMACFFGLVLLQWKPIWITFMTAVFRPHVAVRTLTCRMLLCFSLRSILLLCLWWMVILWRLLWKMVSEIPWTLFRDTWTTLWCSIGLSRMLCSIVWTWMSQWWVPLDHCNICLQSSAAFWWCITISTSLAGCSRTYQNCHLHISGV